MTTDEIISLGIKDKKVISYFSNNEKISKSELRKRIALFLLNKSQEPHCYCGNKLEFQSKIKQTPFGGWRSYCSRLCMQKDPNLIQKKKQTKLEKYGKVGFGSTEKWSEERKQKFKEKTQKTSLEKYGVTHYSKTDEYIRKREQTSLEKYGVKNTFELVKNRNPWFSTEDGQMWLKTNNPMQDTQKNIKARIKKYQKRSIDENLYNILITEDKERFKEYIISLNKTNRYEIANTIGFSVVYLNALFRKFDMSDMFVTPKHFSKGEQEIISFLKEELNISDDQILLHDRSLLKNGMELDIVIKDKLAIEFNGMLWHSETFGGKDKYYHVNKTNNCPLPLLHILDVEWYNDSKKDIWKSIIKHKLNMTENKIFARKCQIKKIANNLARQFLNNNHLEGYIPSKYHYGLYHNDELVSVMSIGKSRFTKNENEIIRYATKLNTVVVGGLSKFLSNINVDNLYTYANRRYASQSYKNVGELIKITDPSWWGFNRKEYVPYHRLKFQKHRLHEIIDIKSELSVYENMLENNYDRIWDCGNYKYIINNKRLL